MWLIILVVVVIIVIVKVNNDRKEQQRIEFEAQERKRLELEAQHKREREEQERQERQERERQRKQEQERITELRNLFNELFELVLYPEDSFPEDKFNKLLELKHTSIYNLVPVWRKEYQLFIEKINHSIYKSLKSIQDSSRIYPIAIYSTMISNDFKKLKYLDETDAFDDAISELDEIWDVFFNHPLYIDYEDYGNCKIDISFDVINEEAIQLRLEELENHQKELKSFQQFDINSIVKYTEITEYLNINDMFGACLTMWYYALKKPFIVDLFERACKAFRFYSNSNDCECMEIMLAKIYNWKSLGGNNLVMEHQQEILEWLENIININNNKKSSEAGSLSFIEFASTLAWLELYDLELIVLKKLVELKVQLWPDAQERLKFLSSGGTANIKIYEPQNEIFSFDTSSADWKEKEYNIFFRKLAMKKIQLNYSLVVKNWIKTYPLQNGQKYSAEDLYHEFELMVDDFDGEVTLNKEDATALNLTNVNYQDAMIFRFTSERNRCITMLFHAEKFGRNLNISILTLFTPQKDIELEQLEKYAIAIKTNAYTDSFQESILECLDEVLKTKTTVYDTNGFFD